MRKIPRKKIFLKDNESKPLPRSLSVERISKTMHYTQTNEIRNLESAERKMHFLNDEYISLNKDIFNISNIIETKKESNKIIFQILKQKQFELQKRKLFVDINSKNYQEIERKKSEIQNANDSVANQITQYQKQISKKYHELKLSNAFLLPNNDFETLMKLQFEVNVLDEEIAIRKKSNVQFANELIENEKLLQICCHEESQFNYLINSLKADLANLNERFFKAQIQHGLPITEIKPLSDFVSFLEVQVENYEKQLSSMVEDIRQINLEIASETSQYYELSTNAALKKKMLDLRQDTIEKGKSMLKKAKLTGIRKVDIDKEECHQYPFMVAEICETLNNNRRDYKKSNTELKQYLIEYTKLKETAEQLLNQKRKTIRKLQSQFHAIDRLKLTISREQQNLDELEEKLYSLNSTIKITSLDYSKTSNLYQSHRNELKSIIKKKIQIEAKEQEVSTQKEQVDIKNKELLNKEAFLNNLEKELAQKETKIDDLSSIILELHKRLNEISLELERELNFSS